MLLLSKQSERVKQAFKALRTDQDFDQIRAWLEYSLAELDQASRATIDGALLRQQQGAAQVLAHIVEAAQGRERAIASPVKTIGG